LAGIRARGEINPAIISLSALVRGPIGKVVAWMSAKIARWRSEMEKRDGEARWRSEMEKRDGEARWKSEMEKRDGRSKSEGQIYYPRNLMVLLTLSRREAIRGRGKWPARTYNSGRYRSREVGRSAADVTIHF
jgi:hypothetical protein